jgi:hypothetical protein
MADDHDSLLREVEEEIRREQMQKMWQRYNGLILGAAALIVLAVAGYKFLETRRIAAEQSAGAEYAAAESLSDDKKKDEAKAAFKKLADGGPSGYGSLAKLQLAGAQVKDGKAADAIATYDSLAADSGVDNLLKSFAQLQAASLRMPDADYAEIQNRLTPLAGDDAPFSKSARELLGIAAYKAGKYDEARKYLEPLLIDPNASEALQERVKIVMSDIAASEVASNTKASDANAPKASTNGAADGKPAETDAKPKPDAATGTETKK